MRTPTEDAIDALASTFTEEFIDQSAEVVVGALAISLVSMLDFAAQHGHMPTPRVMALRDELLWLLGSVIHESGPTRES